MRVPQRLWQAGSVGERLETVRTAHTADLDPATQRAVRALLYEAFEGDMTEHEWRDGDAW